MQFNYPTVMSKRPKLYIGPRLRRLRRDLGLTQAQMAEEIGISTSYVNLIESNQRPLTAELLVKLAQTYNLEVSSFAGDGGEELFDTLQSIFTDPMFQEVGVTRADLQDLASGSPALAEALSILYTTYGRTRDALNDAQSARGDPIHGSPMEEARAFVLSHKNYFHSLEDAAERLCRSMQIREGNVGRAIEDWLQTRHRLSVKILPADVMMGAFRRLDRHRNQVVISEALDHASRQFQLALQLVFIEMADRLDAILSEYDFHADAGRKITRTALANYTAAAIIMPYREFRQGAIDLRYDVEALSRRFGASFEQVCHRLTTLQRPGYEGIPFFFVRVDPAGNVSKRYDGGGFPFARYGGSCPLWNVHRAFHTPREILTQIIELPGEERFFSIARTVSGGAGGFAAPRVGRAVALGCPIQHAGDLVYTDGVNLENAIATPIGVTCRMCDRQDCVARAHPPLNKRLLADDYHRGGAPFAFAFD